MRRENVSSVPALQRGLTPKRRHQTLPFRATRPAADPIFSHLPGNEFRKNRRNSPLTPFLQVILQTQKSKRRPNCTLRGGTFVVLVTWPNVGLPSVVFG